jgi:hypothetical protein
MADNSSRKLLGHPYQLVTTSEFERPIELKPWWQALHALCFTTGGGTFIAGTACLYFPSWPSSALVSALLYIIGSIGFLGVDIQEFFTYTEDKVLRINIAMSASGSMFYVIGSFGFIPAILRAAPYVGSLGFIVGSFLISVSQLWKTCRYVATPGMNTMERVTAIGVELGAGIGAFFFLVGTIMLAAQPAATGAFFHAILNLWMLGSVFFTLGAGFLSFRHAAMHIS